MARWKFRSQAEGRPMGIAGRLFLSLFFLFFLGIGSIIVAFIAREAYQNARTWFWEPVEAEVVSSGIREEDRDSNPYVVEIEYTYEFNGQRHTGTRFKPGGEAAFSDYGEAQRVKDAHGVGARVTAYVNSAAPSQAVLKRGQLWLIPLVLFPMIFVAIGAGGIWFAWRGAGKAVSPGRPVVESISERARGSGGGCFLIGFFCFFLLLGGVVFVFMFVRPVLGILDARNWVETPCVVESSQVRSHRGDDGTTYSVDILYRYEVNGREHKSNRYHFMGGSSSGRGGKQAIVREHPPGRATVCYVNPRDSTEAVLEREFTHDLWFGLIPLLFVGVGAGGIVWGVRKLRAGPEAVPRVRGWVQPGSRIGGAGGIPAVSGMDEGMPVTLKPRWSPWGKVLGMLFFALFWNGITGVFVWQAIQSWRSGRPEWFLTIFMIPFVLIGLVLIGAVFHFVLALWNPRPTLRLTPGAPRLGQAMSLEWEFSGRVRVIERLRVYLEGREEATYRQGTRTSTDKSVFAEIDLANEPGRLDLYSGRVETALPVKTMHSFESDNNKIVWNIRVKGSIARWPDVDEEFPVTVLPAEDSRGGRT